MSLLFTSCWFQWHGFPTPACPQLDPGVQFLCSSVKRKPVTCFFSILMTVGEVCVERWRGVSESARMPTSSSRVILVTEKREKRRHVFVKITKTWFRGLRSSRKNLVRTVALSYPIMSYCSMGNFIWYLVTFCYDFLRRYS